MCSKDKYFFDWQKVQEQKEFDGVRLRLNKLINVFNKGIIFYPIEPELSKLIEYFKANSFNWELTQAVLFMVDKLISEVDDFHDKCLELRNLIQSSLQSKDEPETVDAKPTSTPKLLLK